MEAKKLGRGLDDLMRRREPPDTGARELDIGLIFPNRYQPREGFNEEGLEELAASIKAAGVLQPVVVRTAGAGYELVLGERRWRAARRAGLTRIPAMVRDVSEEQLLQYALIENLQREDLNPVEQAKAYKMLGTKFGLTQEEVADRVGIDRSTVANVLRILDLPEEVQAEIGKGNISMGHAKLIMAQGPASVQRQLAREVVEKGMSVREFIERLRKMVPRERKGIGGRRRKRMELVDIEQRLMDTLGCPVKISEREGKGSIRIDFSDMTQCKEIIDRLLAIKGG